MEIEGYCKNCDRYFDAHWSNYPEMTVVEAVMRPYCLYCKSIEVYTNNDEINDAQDAHELDSDFPEED